MRRERMAPILAERPAQGAVACRTPVHSGLPPVVPALPQADTDVMVRPHPGGDERGFTIVELLVVMLVIGILAAIALPAFLGQQHKGQDAEAKANARQLLTHVESCAVEAAGYDECNTISELGPINLDWGSGAGQVSVTAATTSGYTIVARSRSGTDFRIVRSGIGTPPLRTCSQPRVGGCRAGGDW